MTAKEIQYEARRILIAVFVGRKTYRCSGPRRRRSLNLYDSLFLKGFRKDNETYLQIVLRISNLGEVENKLKGKYWSDFTDAYDTRKYQTAV
jgi:hypothetical protein